MDDKTFVLILVCLVVVVIGLATIFQVLGDESYFQLTCFDENGKTYHRDRVTPISNYEAIAICRQNLLHPVDYKIEVKS